MALDMHALRYIHNSYDDDDDGDDDWNRNICDVRLFPIAAPLISLGRGLERDSCACQAQQHDARDRDAATFFC